MEVEAGGRGAARSTPVNMPGARPAVPVLIDSGSASQCTLLHAISDNHWISDSTDIHKYKKPLTQTQQNSKKMLCVQCKNGTFGYL